MSSIKLNQAIVLKSAQWDQSGLFLHCYLWFWHVLYNFTIN